MFVQRNLVKQEFMTFGLTVGTTGTPINANMGLTTMIDSIVISVPSTAANSVFLGGDSGVTTTTGIEVPAGVPLNLVIDHEGRQMYELQFPLIEIAVAAQCRSLQPEKIPFVVWDVSQIYLVAVANTNIVIGVFKAMFI